MDHFIALLSIWLGLIESHVSFCVAAGLLNGVGEDLMAAIRMLISVAYTTVLGSVFLYLEMNLTV